MGSEIICTDGIDIVPLSRWNAPPNGNIGGVRRSVHFNPNIDKIDLQGHKIENLVLAYTPGGVLVHYIPKKWQKKLANKYTGSTQFLENQISAGKISAGMTIHRNYNDILFWGTRTYSEGPERIHYFRSPKGTTNDFIFLLGKSKVNQFKTWDNGRIIFLGANAKAEKNQKTDGKYFKITRPSTFNKKNVIKITKFNRGNGTIEIDNESFGIDKSASFKAVKNTRKLKKLTKKKINYLYNRSNGRLYFNENGNKNGFGDGGIVAILKGGPKLSLKNLEYIRKTISVPKKYKKRLVDKIINFRASNEKLKVKIDDFGINKSPKFKAAKNAKQRNMLTRKDIDFIYDQKKGGLYFNENGSKKGFGKGGIIAILKGTPNLSANNFEFI